MFRRQLNRQGLLVVLAGLAACGVATAQEVRGAVQARSASQIGALMHEKQNRTPAQRKIGSQLLLSAKISRGTITRDVPGLRSSVATINGFVTVDIEGTVSDEVLTAIGKAGGAVESAHAKFEAIRAQLPLAQVENIAALSDVRSVQPAVGVRHAGLKNVAATKTRSGTAASSAPISATSSAVVAQSIGSVSSQADAVHRAAPARSTFGITGAGVKIGVISDSVDGLAASQSRGDLPAVTVLSGRSGVPGSGEGTAMLELIHDLAPGATLYFSTGLNSPADMAQNILDLRAAGCDIIVDDLLYYNESPFQDGPIAQAVTQVTADGALYFSAAGNEGNKNDGTSATWEGDFSAGSTLTYNNQTLGTRHRFGSVEYNAFNGTSSESVQLFWSDPTGGSSNDYDLYITDASGNIVAAATDYQNGSQDPYEIVDVGPGERIVVVRYSGAARYLYLQAWVGPFAVGTPGGVRGHAATSSAVAVAATEAARSYPNAFSGGSTNPVETYSADGPRRVFYRPNGTAYTSSLLDGGGTVIQKPDITAADGTATSVDGFSTFYGTSAAVANAGGIAALVKSYKPSLTAAQLLAALKNTALDIEATGTDRDSGVGIIMAYQAIASLAGTSKNTPVNVSVSPASGSSAPDSYVTFTSRYSDADGSGNIAAAVLQFTDTAGKILRGYYNANVNKLYLLADDGTYVGGFAPGSSNIILSERGVLDCAQTTITTSGTNTLVVNWRFAFSGAWAGTSAKSALYVRDKDGLKDGYDQLGTWNVSGNLAPVNVGLSPANSTSAVGVARSFNSVYSDPNGYLNLASVLLRVGPDNTSGLLARYVASTKKLYLLNDAGTAYIGGFAPGSSNVIATGRGTLNCASTTVSGSGENLTVNWNITPKSTFIGRFALNLLCYDRANLHDGFERYGTWTVTSTGTVSAYTATVVAKGGTELSMIVPDAAKATLTLTFSDALDAASAADAIHYSVEINGELVPVQSALYKPGDNSVTLQLPADSLTEKDEVLVAWSGLRDAAGAALSGGTVSP